MLYEDKIKKYIEFSNTAIQLLTYADNQKPTIETFDILNIYKLKPPLSSEIERLNYDIECHLSSTLPAELIKLNGIEDINPYYYEKANDLLRDEGFKKMLAYYIHTCDNSYNVDKSQKNIQEFISSEGVNKRNKIYRVFEGLAEKIEDIVFENTVKKYINNALRR